MVLRQLLHAWVRTTAERKVREKFAEQAPAGGDEQPRCDVAVILALASEAGGLEERLTDPVVIRGHGIVVRRGRLEDRLLAVVRSGAGRDAAASATEAVIRGHQPGWVISAGFAGGLDPKLERGDVLMADHLVDTAGEQLDIDLTVDPTELAKTPGVHVGRLLTADRIIRTPDEKRSLGEKHAAVAVDMETFAVAQVCRGAKVRLMAVRVISDAADDELPPDVEHLLKQATAPGKIGAAAGAVFRRPGSLKDMLQLKETALAASERLAKFLVGMIGQMPTD